MRFLSAAAALLVLSACATPAAPVAAAPAAATTEVASAETADTRSKVVCRNVEVIGSRFPKKECKTKDAWDKFDTMMADEGRQGVDKMQKLGSGASTSTN